MHKIFALILSVLLCASCAACGGKEPSEPLEPYSAPEDIASIIEPLDKDPESTVESESESESESEPEPEPEPESEGQEQVRQVEPESNPAPKPAAETIKAETQQPEKESASEAPEPERLNAVARGKLDGSVIERELLRMINEEREASGVEALGEEESMRFAARIRAAEALESFSHTRPDGTPYNTAFDEAGFSYAGKWHGENMASLQFTEGMYDEKSAAFEMFTGLKNSKGHYQNMVGVNFYQAGIGVSIRYSDGMANIASVQLFSSL